MATVKNHKEPIRQSNFIAFLFGAGGFLAIQSFKMDGLWLGWFMLGFGWLMYGVLQETLHYPEIQMTPKYISIASAIYFTLCVVGGLI